MSKNRSILHNSLLGVVCAVCLIPSFSSTAKAQTEPILLPCVSTYKDYETVQRDSSSSKVNLKPVVETIALSQDGSTLFVGGDDHRIYAGSTTQTDSFVFKPILNALEDWVRAVDVCPVEGSNEIVTLSQNGQLAIWNYLTQQKLREASFKTEGTHSLAVSPNGKIIAVCGYKPQVHFFNAKTLQKEQPVWEAPGESSTSLVFSNDGRLLALGGRNGVVRVWNTIDGTIFKEFTLVNSEDSVTKGKKIPRRVRAVSFDPSGKLLAAAGDSNQTIVWDLASGQVVASLCHGNSKVFSMTFCDSDLLVTGDSVNHVNVWKISEQKIIAQGVEHTGTVTDLLFDPRTRTILSSSYDATVRRWSLP